MGCALSSRRAAAGAGSGEALEGAVEMKLTETPDIVDWPETHFSFVGSAEPGEVPPFRAMRLHERMGHPDFQVSGYWPQNLGLALVQAAAA